MKNFPSLIAFFEPSELFVRPIGKNCPSCSLFPESKVILLTNNKFVPLTNRLSLVFVYINLGFISPFSISNKFSSIFSPSVPSLLSLEYPYTFQLKYSLYNNLSEVE